MQTPSRGNNSHKMWANYVIFHKLPKVNNPQLAKIGPIWSPWCRRAETYKFGQSQNSVRRKLPLPRIHPQFLVGDQISNRKKQIWDFKGPYYAYLCSFLCKVCMTSRCTLTVLLPNCVRVDGNLFSFFPFAHKICRYMSIKIYT
jgi:hypothetical protein